MVMERRLRMSEVPGVGDLGPQGRLSMPQVGRLVLMVMVVLGAVLLMSLGGDGRSGGESVEYRMEVGPIELLEYLDPVTGQWVPSDESVSPPRLLSDDPNVVVLRHE
jgi:hypothetical protein